MCVGSFFSECIILKHLCIGQMERQTERIRINGLSLRAEHMPGPIIWNNDRQIFGRKWRATRRGTCKQIRNSVKQTKTGTTERTRERNKNSIERNESENNSLRWSTNCSNNNKNVYIDLIIIDKIWADSCGYYTYHRLLVISIQMEQWQRKSKCHRHDVMKLSRIFSHFIWF